MNRVPLWLRDFGNAAQRSLTSGIASRRRLWTAAAVVVSLLAAAPLVRMNWQRQMLIDKLQRSREECRRADDNLLLAMETIGNRIDHLGLETQSLPKVQLEFYKAIYDQTVSEPAERFAIAVARKHAGLIRLKLNEAEEARLCFTLAIHMLEELAVGKPDSEQTRVYNRTLAETHSDYAAYQDAINDPIAAETEYAAALAILSKLIEKWPNDNIDLIDNQARIWHDRGAMEASFRAYSEAEADFHRAIAVWLKRCASQSDSMQWLGSPACELAANWLQLSDLYRDEKRSSDARAAINQAMAIYTSFNGYQSDPHFREGHTDALDTLAAIYFDDRQITQSVEAYRKALAEYDALSREYPEVSAYRRKHSQIETRLGSLAKAAQNRE